MKFKIAILISLLLAWMPAAFGAAANESVEFEITSGGDDSLAVVISARGADDVYAYELILTFDERRLKLEKVEASHNGLLVEPLVDGERIRIAHTLIGPRRGLKGDIQLATLRFKRLAPGSAEVALNEVKLVDGSIESILFTPSVKTELTDKTPELVDIAVHWAKKPIQEAVRRGIVAGYGDGTFRPERQVTRAEFAAMLARALGLQGKPDADSAFEDADRIPAWAAASITAMAEAGIIMGYDDGTFRADRRIDRAEMTVMLARASGLKPESALALSAFADREQIPDWAKTSIAAAVDAGIVQGKTGNRFAPGDVSKRAEAVVAIMNLLASPGK